VSVEFDPERLDRRRRRVEPAVIGAIAVAIGIVAAIAKPWDAAPTTPPPAPQAVVAPSVSPSPQPPAQAAPDWTAVTTAVTAHDAWGVTAVLSREPAADGATTASPRYSEQWTPAPAEAGGADTAVVTRGGAEVAALGITVPDAVPVRAVRLWRLHQSNELEWIDATRIDDPAQRPAPLLVRLPLLDGVDLVPWEAGTYRVDVLVGDAIRRISVVIAGQFGDPPGPDDWPTGLPDTVEATASDPSGVQFGLFATVDGVGVSIPSRQTEPLDEAQAWDDVSVMAAYLPRATGLGVMLTSHAAVEAASIRRLSPEPLSDPPDATGGISNLRGRTPYVVFPAPGDGVWTPGVYALSVDWKDAAGAHRGTWQVELRPGAS